VLISFSIGAAVSTWLSISFLLPGCGGDHVLCMPILLTRNCAVTSEYENSVANLVL